MSKDNSTGLTTTVTAIVPQNFEELQRFAKAVTASAYFAKDAADIAQSIVKIAYGAEIGIPPIASMRGVYVVKGVPTLGANLIASRVKSSEKYDYKIIALDNEKCILRFYERGEACQPDSEFTIDDAKKANLLGSNTWKQYARNMLFARALTNGCRWHCPDIFHGGVYTAEEIKSGNFEELEGDRVAVEVKQVDEVIEAELCSDDVVDAEFVDSPTDPNLIQSAISMASALGAKRAMVDGVTESKILKHFNRLGLDNDQVLRCIAKHLSIANLDDAPDVFDLKMDEATSLLEKLAKAPTPKKQHEPKADEVKLDPALMTLVQKIAAEIPSEKRDASVAVLASCTVEELETALERHVPGDAGQWSAVVWSYFDSFAKKNKPSTPVTTPMEPSEPRSAEGVDGPEAMRKHLNMPKTSSKKSSGPSENPEVLDAEQ